MVTAKKCLLQEIALEELTREKKENEKLQSKMTSLDRQHRIDMAMISSLNT